MTRRTLRAAQGAAIVAAASMMLTACGGSSTRSSAPTFKVNSDGTYGTIPAQSSSTTTGGTISFAEQPGASINQIFPIAGDGQNSVYNISSFIDLMWRPLLWSPQGANPVVDYSKSLVAAPVVSNGGKTFTMTLNSSYKWSDGTPVTAKDALFDFDLLKAADTVSAADNAGYVPGQFPDNATASVSGNSIAFTFNKVYNPNWVEDNELDQLYALPSNAWDKASATGPALDWTQPANAVSIFKYLYAQNKDLSTYASNPLWQVVDGPFKISTFNTTTGSTNLVANSAYGGPIKPTISQFDEIAYTSTEAEFNALLSGTLDVGLIDESDIPQLKRLESKGYSAYGEPDFGFNDVTFNFKDTTDNFDKVIAQPYIRQAIAHLQDQNAEINGAFKGAGVPQFGSVGLLPKSPFAPADALTNPYPFSVAAAKQLLTSHGWSAGSASTPTTCINPGTGPTQCGAGIAKGQDISLVFQYSSSPSFLGIEDQSIAGNMQSVGMKVDLTSGSFDTMINNDNDPNDPKNENAWGMAQFGGYTNGIYPSTDFIFNTGGPENGGDFSDPALDQLIANDSTSTSPTALSDELSAVATDLPALFTANPDLIYAWKNTITGPADSFQTLSQYYANPEEWAFTSSK